MANKDPKKLKRVILQAAEGGLFGCFSGIFIYLFLYLVFQLTSYSRGSGGSSGGINIDFVPFAVRFSYLVISFLVFSALSRLLIALFSKQAMNSFTGWIAIGVSSICLLYLSVLITEIYNTVTLMGEWSCCKGDSFDLALWLTILVSLVIFTAIYAKVRKFAVHFLNPEHS